MTSQLLGIDSSVPARGCVWTRSQSRIHQRLGTSAILIARTQDTWHESTCAREHVRRCQGGGRRRGFRCTMQAEAYIVIIIISPLDIKDLSFSLFASLSLLLPFPWPLTGTSFSLLLSLSPVFYPAIRVSLPGCQRFLPRSFRLAPSGLLAVCFPPVQRVALVLPRNDHL